MIPVSRSEQSHGGSLGMAPVLLLYGNHREIADGIFPNSVHVGHARLLQRQPHVCGAQRHRLSRNSRRHSEDDRIVAIHYVLNFHHRFVMRAGGVVTGPFTKRPFRSAFSLRRHDVTLDRQLGSGRNRQPGFLTTNDFYRLIAQPASDFYFGHAPWLIPTAHFRQHRILTESDGYRTRLTLRPILFSNQSPMLTRRNPNPQCVTIVNADTIRPKVSPLLIGVLQNDQTTCADVTAAVFLVPTGRRKLEHIDHVPSVNIFGDRSARYIDGLKRLV